MNYQLKLERLNNRYNPERSVIIENRMSSEDFSFDTDITRYVKRAMMAVDSNYTNKTKEAGENVKTHLRGALTDVSFRYQGSVMTDTHIRGASDIDLLVICEKFYGTDITRVRQELANDYIYPQTIINRLRKYESSFSPYQGDSHNDLLSIRRAIELAMLQTYDICDISKAKAVQITNQHLHRDVDIVTSSWFDSFEYVKDGMPENKRGIKIYNKDLGIAEGPDYPFLSIERINDKSSESNGRLKRMIRFLKNVRTDSEKDINLTSFDINAICYSIPIEDYVSLDYKSLVHVIWSTMFHLWYDHKQDTLKSVAGDEYIFKDKPAKVESLKLLEDEVYKIKTELERI